MHYYQLIRSYYTNKPHAMMGTAAHHRFDYHNAVLLCDSEKRYLR
jgi:hypothetical protein